MKQRTARRPGPVKSGVESRSCHTTLHSVTPEVTKKLLHTYFVGDVLAMFNVSGMLSVDPQAVERRINL